jgi:uncharacterized membrane protein YecN with MAPEG domain
MQLHIDIYIWCAFQVFVFLKLAANVGLQVRARAITGITGYPEDSRGKYRVAHPDPAAASDDALNRALNLFRNDLENLVPFSLVSLAAAFVQVAPVIYILLLAVFAVARIGHAASLIGGLQPLRAICYLVGWICSLVLVIMTIARLIPIFMT